MELTIGQKAPITVFVDSTGKTFSLLGKKTVLYFYPKDDTPGCTAQACNLSENLDYLTSKGFQVVGVSADSSKSHDKFIAKYQLKFPLISDESHEIVEAFGVWVEKSMYGKTYLGIARTTFVFDEEGIITDIITKVDTKNHTEQIH
jgi:peroxiredoxin Q/BCP